MMVFKTETYPINRIFPSGLHKNVDIFGDNKFTLTATKIFSTQTWINY